MCARRRECVSHLDTTMSQDEDLNRESQRSLLSVLQGNPNIFRQGECRALKAFVLERLIVEQLHMYVPWREKGSGSWLKAKLEALPSSTAAAIERVQTGARNPTMLSILWAEEKLGDIRQYDPPPHFVMPLLCSVHALDPCHPCHLPSPPF